MDREQGGNENVRDNNINFHRYNQRILEITKIYILIHNLFFFIKSIIKASDLLNYLHRKNLINLETKNETVEFLKKHSFQASLLNHTNEIANHAN